MEAFITAIVAESNAVSVRSAISELSGASGMFVVPVYNSGVLYGRISSGRVCSSISNTLVALGSEIVTVSNTEPYTVLSNMGLTLQP